jgi:glycosyltransferase involved in cell wall biosynthesis
MSGKRRLDQLVAGFADGDAISGEAVLLRDHFRKMGFESDIFADPKHVTPRLKDQCRSLVDYSGKAEDLALFHFSIGSPATEVFQKTAAKKIMLYHNITPPEFFWGFDDRVEQQLSVARTDLKTVASVSDAVWADSRFNANEVEALGVRPAQVLPLLFSSKMFDVPSDPVVQARFSGSMTNILFVGRIAPNKRVEDLIQAFAWYHRVINPFSRLVIVGSDRSCPRYYTMLRMLAGELDLPNVCFEGFASPESLSAYYSTAHVFVCASEHEGYCLPLVEAMYRNVPVVARDLGGMPEALGGAGVLYEDLTPQELAELIHQVTANPALRSEVLASQSRRMQEVTARDVEKELANLLQSFKV